MLNVKERGAEAFLKAIIEMNALAAGSFDCGALFSLLIRHIKEYTASKEVAVLKISPESHSEEAYYGDSLAEPFNLRSTSYIACLLNNSLEEVVEEGYVILPIKSRFRVYGILYIATQVDRDDISILKALALQAAIYIERDYLEEGTSSQNNLLAIGMLKASVAHDMSNILNIMQIYAELVRSNIDGEIQVSELLEYTTSLQSEIKRLSVLTKDMLDISKNTIVLRKSHFHLNELMDELMLYSAGFMKDTNIHIEYRTRNNIELYADKDRLFRVLFNIIHNACGAFENLDKRGRIIVYSRKVVGHVCFIIADNGKGMDRDIQKNLFNPFFTFGKSNGNGLGLAIVKEIVDLHNGSIKVRSFKGLGTAFIINIPIE